MKKILFIVMALLIVSVSVVLVAKDLLARFILTKGLSQATGLGFQLNSVEVGLFSGRLEVKGLKIFNPPDFPDRLLADIPQIKIDFDFGAFLLKKKIHLKHLVVDIKQLNIFQDAKNQLNVNSLALLIPPPSGDPPQIQIDRLHLKLGKVSYKNLGLLKGLGLVEFNPNLDEVFENIYNPNELARQIMQRILTRIGISDLAKFGQETLEKAKSTADTAARNLINDAKTSVRNLESELKDTLNKKKEELKTILGK